MISSPGLGQAVQLWYRKDVAHLWPYHGKVGVVAVRARGPGPRNHGVIVDGRLVIVGCGNLRKPPSG